MGQIQVFIPAPEVPPGEQDAGGRTSRSVRSRTVAVPPKKAVIWGETLNWHVHCDHPDVTGIRITFEPHHKDGQRAAMFGPRDPARPEREGFSITKAIPRSDNGATTRTLNVYAQVPVPPGKDKLRMDKYTIVGLDDNGEEIPGTELDPEIITTDPGGG